MELLTTCVIVHNESFYTGAEEVRNYLDKNASADDEIQHLGFLGGGGIRGMLMAKVIPATKHITDYELYFAPETKYIQELRNEHIDQLNSKRPRFIIISDLPKYRGLGFPQLDSFLEDLYTIVHEFEHLSIYEVVL